MVRLREQPNTKSKELKILKEGIVLSVIDFSVEKELITDCDNTIPQHWMAVQGSNSKILGWVYGGCLKLLSPSQNNTNSKTPGVSQQGFYASKY